MRVCVCLSDAGTDEAWTGSRVASRSPSARGTAHRPDDSVGDNEQHHDLTIRSASSSSSTT